MIDFKAEIRPGDLKRITDQLDKWKGHKLATVMGRIERAALSLLIAPVRRRAARHNLTGATQRGYAVRKLPTTGKEISAWKLDSNTTWRAFAVVGTPYITADPYIDETRAALEPQIVSFIDEQVARLT